MIINIIFNFVYSLYFCAKNELNYNHFFEGALKKTKQT